MVIQWIDLSIIIAMVIMLLAVTVYAKKYMNSIADFLAADRLAGRYLLTVSGNFWGVTSIIGIWQMTYSSGLPPTWWSMMSAPVGLFLGLTGFIVYRFRQTRALTLAQFFEERYSRKFRYFAGLLCWISGMLNYGIFPMITANLLIHYLGLPVSFEFGTFTLQTFPCVMLGYLSLAVYIACSGGQITIMVTDFIQGAMFMLIFVVIMVFLMTKFQWNDIISGLSSDAGAGKSMINPFGGSVTSDFNIWYFIIALLGSIYNVKSWQGNSGYNAAAKTPHEAVISGVIASWRMLASTMCIILIPLIAYVVLKMDKFADIAAPIHEQIANLGTEQLKLQMTVPLFLKNILPVGLVGLFAAVILGSAVTFDDTYTHAWGTIFVQDVLTPIRNKPFTPQTHLLMLRLSIISVALFGFVFSLFFKMEGYIFMFFALTGAIYLGGAGAVIIGGLYWKRGTTEAAWTALCVGTLLGFGGVVIQQTWGTFIHSIFNIEHNTPFIALSIVAIMLAIALFTISFVARKNYPKTAIILFIIAGICTFGGLLIFYKYQTIAMIIQNNDLLSAYLIANAKEFPINGQWIYFWAMIAASISYILVSLLGPKRVYDMDKLLHQNKYAIKEDTVIGDIEIVVTQSKFSLAKLIGITAEFSKFERSLFYCTFFWSMGWWFVFVVGTIYNLIWPASDYAWSLYWWFYIWLSSVLGIICTFWIFGGGVRDALRLFSDLKNRRKKSNDDDGFVRNDNDI